MKIIVNALPAHPENCVFANYDEESRSYFCMLGKKRSCVDTKNCKHLELKEVKRGAWCHEGED